MGTIGQRSDDRTIGARRIEQLQSQAIPENTAESIVLLAWVEDLQNRTAWSMLAAFTHVMKERQRRYPNKAAWEVMQFRALLAA